MKKDFSAEKHTVKTIMESMYEQMLQTSGDASEYREKLISSLSHDMREDGSFGIDPQECYDVEYLIEMSFVPTYYATAACIYAANKDGLSDSLRGMLEGGLAYAEKRKLRGHGYDAVTGLMEALKIYTDAGLYEFLQNYGMHFPEFGEMIREIIEDIRTRLAEDRVIADWNIDFRSRFEAAVSDYDLGMSPTVWYVSYGSNMCYQRFEQYLNRCSDSSAPIESKAIRLSHNIYFAAESSTWEMKGVAFLDDTASGMAYGRAYRITAKQFSEIQHFEGAKYSRKINLGVEQGIPVYTFTAPRKYTTMNAPSMDYVNTILAGLQETYPEFPELLLRTYIMDSSIVTAEDRRILALLRGSEHAMTLQAIIDQIGTPAKTRKAVAKLLSLELIKQDSRSIRAGHRPNSREALFYTNKKNREVIEFLLFMHR